jgi:hypothetical protein
VVPGPEMLCGQSVVQPLSELNGGACRGKDIRLRWALAGDGNQGAQSSSRFGMAGIKGTQSGRAGSRPPITR